MKKLSVLFLIAMLGIVLGALPAGAEKIRLSDAELDGITAGKPAFPCGQVCVPLNKTGGVVGAGIIASGGLGGGPHGEFELGSLIPLAGGISVNVAGNGHLSSPTGRFAIDVNVRGQRGGLCVGAGC